MSRSFASTNAILAICSHILNKNIKSKAHERYFVVGDSICSGRRWNPVYYGRLFPPTGRCELIGTKDLVLFTISCLEVRELRIPKVHYANPRIWRVGG